MSAEDKQIGGNHYTSKKVQPWHAMESWMTAEQFDGFLRGNVIKYVARCDDKGGVEDLQKARHYIDRLIEHRERHNDSPSGGGAHVEWLSKYELVRAAALLIAEIERIDREGSMAILDRAGSTR